MSVSTAPWAAIYSDIWTSPKTRHLRRALGVSPETAVGHLLRLWHACLTSAPITGELIGWTELDLAESANWPEADASRFAAALIDARWVRASDHERGGYVLHEWSGYGGQYLASRQSAQARKAKSRDPLDPRPQWDAAEDDGTPAALLGHSDVTVTSHPTDRTGPDLTDKTELRERADALAQARAKVVRDNWNERSRKKAAAEAIYDRPQDVQSLLDHPTNDGNTTGEYLQCRFPLFDGKQGRPTVEERVAALWEASLSKTWGATGRDVIGWLCARMSEDYQRLRQQEHIMADKQAKGVTLPSENRPAQSASDAARYARYDAWSRSIAEATGATKTITQWTALGEPDAGTPIVTTPRVNRDPTLRPDANMDPEQKAAGFAMMRAALAPLTAKLTDTAQTQQRAPHRAEEATPKETEESKRARRADAIRLVAEAKRNKK